MGGCRCGRKKTGRDTIGIISGIRATAIAQIVLKRLSKSGVGFTAGPGLRRNAALGDQSDGVAFIRSLYQPRSLVPRYGTTVPAAALQATKRRSANLRGRATLGLIATCVRALARNCDASRPPTRQVADSRFWLKIRLSSRQGGQYWLSVQGKQRNAVCEEIVLPRKLIQAPFQRAKF